MYFDLLETSRSIHLENFVIPAVNSAELIGDGSERLHGVGSCRISALVSSRRPDFPDRKLNLQLGQKRIQRGKINVWRFEAALLDGYRTAVLYTHAV